MQPRTIGTWQDDPAHFRRPSRRNFLFVGLAGALGLTLDRVLVRFLQIGAGARPRGEHAKGPPGAAASFISSYLAA